MCIRDRHTLELREEDAHTAQQFFRQSAYATQLKLHLGNAKDIIPHLPYEWDVVFIDADKAVSYTHLDVYKRQHHSFLYYCHCITGSISRVSIHI